MNPTASQKTALRAHFLAKRETLAPDAVRAASIAATRRLLGDPAVSAARCVLLYLPVKNEIDTRELFTALTRAGTAILLPRCRPGASGELDLYHVDCLDHVRPGRFDILEPDPARCRPAGTTRPDVAVVPGVAFDRSGVRLGFGGGYYDRFFSRPDMAHARRIGLAHEFQVVDRLPSETWDHPMHALCTPREMTWITP